MKRVLAITGCLFFWLSAAAFAVELSVTPVYWVEPSLDARVKIERNAIGEEINLEENLNIVNENIPGVTVDLKLGRSNHFLLSYWSAGYDGRVTLTAGNTFDFNGTHYNVVGDTVTSSYDLDVVEVGYAFDLLNFETFRCGFLLNVNYYSFDAEISSVNNPVTNRDKADIVLPLPGLRFGIGFLQNKVELTGQFAGLWFQGDGFWDGSVGLSFHPIDKLAITAGYRRIHLDVSDDDDSANIKLDGPTIGAKLRF